MIDLRLETFYESEVARLTSLVNVTRYHCERRGHALTRSYKHTLEQDKTIKFVLGRSEAQTASVIDLTERLDLVEDLEENYRLLVNDYRQRVDRLTADLQQTNAKVRVLETKITESNSLISDLVRINLRTCLRLNNQSGVDLNGDVNLLENLFRGLKINTEREEDGKQSERSLKTSSD